ncbi:threonine synthase [Polaribacter reichenbachii]|uniref:Threonine synthase n=1 Tax=Polaribacter reichenbachii TaxID=996801 RepID=A0A1B8TWH9_9FLAO|nr:glycoside hydrolase family 2 TIM barrel-domain containing protein [Polaribacter reichenbachii]APZ48052.1 threonine synthase [Polaribacter reichenbachii]AUC20526.1 threonine synthase [Polaribacter reichenbachii]OBY63997.1 threonine synthase [Polaribacter reichenbachii]
MNKRFSFLATIFILLLGVFNSVAQDRETDFNFNWKFSLVEDTKKPSKLPLDDENWRDIRLPHDWSIEAQFDEKLEGATGYLPGGVGLYQKHFATPTSTKNKSIYVLFDGVYNNATFWLNGKLLGENPYGYSPTYFDLTKHLKTDGSKNVLTVHVDHSRYVDSRWYSGSGIYRNVKLITVDKLHIPIWGTFVTTPEITSEKAAVNIQVQVANQNRGAASFDLKTKIVDNNGNVVAEITENQKVKGRKEGVFNQKLEVKNPKIWHIAKPNMYTAITTISKKGKIVDSYTTPFGIRSIKHDKEQGFFLNGESVFVKGVCIHHDGGLVGAAVPKGVWRRRLQNLRDAGVNAIRTSHNPFSQEFYDLCDEMGFLVQAEIFDEFDNPKDKRENLNEKHDDYFSRGYTEHFQKWGKSDLTRSILRDRNHPSIFEWSIGNEIEWTYKDYKHVSGLWDEGAPNYWNRIPNISAKEMQKRYQELPDRKYKLAETSKRLAGWVKDLDTSRPVTANLIIPVASLASGYAQNLDIVGFSYQINQYNWSKKYYPELHFTGNENAGAWQEWNSIIEDPMIYSMYMWTGIDYLGEANKQWPQKGWDGDILDFAGFKKAGFDHFKSIWVNKPNLAIGTYKIEDTSIIDSLSGQVNLTKKQLNWNNSQAQKSWNYKKGEMIMVEIPTNLHKVELFLNGKTLGFRSLSQSPDRILRWAVPFQEGVLTAKGGFDGQEQEVILKTTTKPVTIKLSVDKTVLTADGYDVAHVIAQLIDKDGNKITSNNEAKISFSIDGNIRVLGIDNGSKFSVQDYSAKSVITNNGKALLLLQSLKEKGKVTVKFTGQGLKGDSISITVE